MAYEAAKEKRLEVNAKAKRLKIHISWTNAMEMDRLEQEAKTLLGVEK